MPKLYALVLVTKVTSLGRITELSSTILRIKGTIDGDIVVHVTDHLKIYSGVHELSLWFCENKV